MYETYQYYYNIIINIINIVQYYFKLNLNKNLK